MSGHFGDDATERLLPQEQNVCEGMDADGNSADSDEDISLTNHPDFGSYVNESKKQIAMGLPAAGTNFLNFMMQLVSIIFVGHLGTRQLAAAAMAATLSNVTGFALLEGLASAIETLCGQAYGAEQHGQLGIILCRVQLILTLCCVPISMLWFNTQHILIWVGQDRILATLARQYILFLIPGLFGAALYIPLAKFLQAQNCLAPVTAMASIALGVHVALNWLLIHFFGLGYKGAALAFSLADFVQLVLVCFYLKYVDKTGILERTWPRCSFSQLFHKWRQFFMLALPAAAMTCLEWWFFEILIFMSGWLPDPEASVGAMTICFQTAGVCYMLPLGLGTAVCVRVSNELGRRQPGRAKLAVQSSVCVALLLSGALGLLLLLFRKKWPLLFTEPDQVLLLELLLQLTPSLLLSQLGIGLIAVLAGVLRGSGQQLVGSIVNGAAFYVLALPTAAILAFGPFKLGVLGLWWGLMLGVLVQIIVIGVLTAVTDWSHQAERAAGFLQEEHVDEVDVMQLLIK